MVGGINRSPVGGCPVPLGPGATEKDVDAVPKMLWEKMVVLLVVCLQRHTKGGEKENTHIPVYRYIYIYIYIYSVYYISCAPAAYINTCQGATYNRWRSPDFPNALGSE